MNYEVRHTNLILKLEHKHMLVLKKPDLTGQSEQEPMV